MKIVLYMFSLKNHFHNNITCFVILPYMKEIRDKMAVKMLALEWTYKESCARWFLNYIHIIGISNSFVVFHQIFLETFDYSNWFGPLSRIRRRIIFIALQTLGIFHPNSIVDEKFIFPNPLYHFSFYPYHPHLFLHN